MQTFLASKLLDDPHAWRRFSLSIRNQHTGALDSHATLGEVVDRWSVEVKPYFELEYQVDAGDDTLTDAASESAVSMNF